MDAPERRGVRVVTRKWPDKPHWEFPAVRLGVDAYGQWLGVAQGTWLSRPGRGFSAECDQVMLLPHDGWWLATLYGDDVERPVNIYVDIATPWKWSADESEARAVDLDLDVIQRPDGSIYVDDEDEFAEHQVTLGYPAELIAEAERSCVQVLAAVSSGAAPFDGIARDWLARFRAR